MASGLNVSVPAERLMALANKFKNNDFLATYTREVKCESAVNYTTTQVMQLVLGLDRTLSNVPGMTTVGREIAQCLKPLIGLKITADDADDIAALFLMTPSDIKVLGTTDESIKSEMDTAARDTTTKFDKKSSIDNYQTIFYMLTVLANYSPRKKTFDFYYAYVYARDTSIWQWARTGCQKKKRMAALELEGSYLLGTTLACQSNNTVTAVPSHTNYIEEARILGADYIEEAQILVAN